MNPPTEQPAYKGLTWKHVSMGRDTRDEVLTPDEMDKVAVPEHGVMQYMAQEYGRKFKKVDAALQREYEWFDMTPKKRRCVDGSYIAPYRSKIATEVRAEIVRVKQAHQRLLSLLEAHSNRVKNSFDDDEHLAKLFIKGDSYCRLGYMEFEEMRVFLEENVWKDMKITQGTSKLIPYDKAMIVCEKLASILGVDMVEKSFAQKIYTELIRKRFSRKRQKKQEEDEFYIEELNLDD